MKTRIERLLAWIETGSPAAMALSWFAAIVFVSAILWGCTGSVRSNSSLQPCTPYFIGGQKYIDCIEDL